MPLDLSSLENSLFAMNKILTRSLDHAFMDAQDEVTQNAIRAGVIQHFEIVFELCWKFIQRWIRQNRTPEDSDLPRTRKELFRMAARDGLVADPLPWFEYAEARNLTSHTYHEEQAAVVYDTAFRFIKDAEFLLMRLKEKND